MTLDDLEPLLAYWNDNPPAHVILGAVHLKKKSRRHRMSEASPISEAELVASGVLKINRTKKHG